MIPAADIISLYASKKGGDRYYGGGSTAPFLARLSEFCGEIFMNKVLTSIFVGGFFALCALTRADENVRVLEFHTEKVGEVMHWMPQQVSVSPGEKIKFVLKHELTGGFDFHGFTIRELNIAKQVVRMKTLEFETTVPKNLKVGEYKITCQFHPKHMGASMMLIKDAPTAPVSPAKK